MQLNDFDFHLPEELVAKRPLEHRTMSKLLRFDRKSKIITDNYFYSLKDFLMPNDILVFNDTRVNNARIYGKKTTGANVECLIESFKNNLANCIVKGRNIKSGQELIFQNGISGVVQEVNGANKIVLFNLNVSEVMSKIGNIPIPPYFNRPADQNDIERYQTVYAKSPGAIAAPTAGLHFDQELIQDIQDTNILTTNITLHVGAGTFQPVTSNDISKHIMHSESYFVSANSAELINHSKQKGGRVIAVGTTVARTLETLMQNNGKIEACSGMSNIFITPGFKFRAVDALITNFHLPKSTLLMMISAFMGHEKMQHCYQHAIQEKYRFYSYGDAMMIT